VRDIRWGVIKGKGKKLRQIVAKAFRKKGADDSARKLTGGSGETGDSFRSTVTREKWGGVFIFKGEQKRGDFTT